MSTKIGVMDDVTQGDALPPVTRGEVCSGAALRRIAAMLDLSDAAAAHEGAVLPRGWHFFLLAADTPRSALRADGFPGLGVPMPDLGLPRLMLGGRTVQFNGDIPVDAAVLRTSAVRGIERKTSASGPMAVVTLSHELCVAGQAAPAIAETQTFVLLPDRPAAARNAEPAPASPAAVQARHLKTVVPDDTLLFQYSALCFNSHRIHIDREHARQVEGFPDLVVNGGLSTLLMTEFLRQELGARPKALAVRHVAPLFCNRTVTLAADPSDRGWRLRAFDDRSRLAVDMEVTV